MLAGCCAVVVLAFSTVRAPRRMTFKSTMRTSACLWTTGISHRLLRWYRTIFPLTVPGCTSMQLEHRCLRLRMTEQCRLEVEHREVTLQRRTVGRLLWMRRGWLTGGMCLPGCTPVIREHRFHRMSQLLPSLPVTSVLPRLTSLRMKIMEDSRRSLCWLIHLFLLQKVCMCSCALLLLFRPESIF